MPAHITHNIFADDVIEKTIQLNIQSGQAHNPLTGSLLDRDSGKISGDFGCFFHIGCQGPDIFYHNRRLRPSGLKFGQLLHRRGYGSFVRIFLEKTCEKPARSETERKELLERFAFILGFVTHAILDRHTHPFINYFSGWVDPSKPQTRRYFRCHAFLERIIDVMLLKEKREQDILHYDFFSTFFCGEDFPPSLIRPYYETLKYVFPNELKEEYSVAVKRLNNAYRDSIFFYKITDPRNPRLIAELENLDLEGEKKSRRLALVHPIELKTDIDFLNLNHKKWCNPCDCSNKRSESFLELYDMALKETMPLVERIIFLLDSVWKKDTDESTKILDEIEVAIGNGNLDTDIEGLDSCKPIYSSPLPLPELLDNMYDELYRDSGRYSGE